MINKEETETSELVHTVICLILSILIIVFTLSTFFAIVIIS